MQILTSNRAIVLAVSLALIFALGVMTSTAGEKTKVSGKMTAAFTKQEKAIVGDTEGHVIGLNESEGTNVSTGKHKFMDGAQLVLMGSSDLVKGTGTEQGYGKFTQNGDAVFFKWEGKLTTTVSTEGTHTTTFAGTFSFIKGTGQFENIHGSGTYKGKAISETSWIAKWEGKYSVKK